MQFETHLVDVVCHILFIATIPHCSRSMVAINDADWHG